VQRRRTAAGKIGFNQSLVFKGQSLLGITAYLQAVDRSNEIGLKKRLKRDLFERRPHQRMEITARLNLGFTYLYLKAPWGEQALRLLNPNSWGK